MDDSAIHNWRKLKELSIDRHGQDIVCMAKSIEALLFALAAALEREE